MLDTTIIIPQFNHSELTCGCLHSLRAAEPHIWPAIVVDDGSAPGCRQAVISRNFAETRLVGQAHAGVSAAWNRGAAEARTPYVVFLNNDVLAFGPGVGRLVEPLKTGRAVLSGVSLRRETRLPQRTLRNLPSDRYLEGWCFAASLESIHQVGGFDETMRVYWSDTDFQSRLMQSRGAVDGGMVHFPDLPWRHLGHRTARMLPERRRIWQADRAAFIAKWG